MAQEGADLHPPGYEKRPQGLIASDFSYTSPSHPPSFNLFSAAPAAATGSAVPFENSHLGATHNTRSKIDKIGIVNNNGGRRTGTVRIGHRRARAEQHDLRLGCVFLRRLARWLLGRGCWRYQ